MTPSAFRAQRHRLNLTQVELAALIRVHPLTVAAWEQGKRPIPGSAEVLVRLLKSSTLAPIGETPS